jgi:hypothetical protein
MGRRLLALMVKLKEDRKNLSPESERMLKLLEETFEDMNTSKV